MTLVALGMQNTFSAKTCNSLVIILDGNGNPFSNRGPAEKAQHDQQNRAASFLTIW